MLVKCKKQVNDSDDINKLLYVKGTSYEAEIVFDDILVKDEFGEFGLVGIRGAECERLKLKSDVNGWDSWFNEHFEIVP